MTELDFVVIGAQKAGSTTLAVGLSQHPDIWMPATEVDVYRDPVYSASAEQALLRTLRAHSDAARRGIKCPDYLGRAEVPPRLAALPVAPKLLVVLRDPVARAVSSYYWHVRWGLLPVEDPNIGIAKVLDGHYAAHDPTSSDILDWGLYGKHLTHYLSLYPRELLHILFDWQLRDCPQAAFGSAFGFLGVDTAFLPTIDEKSANEGIYSQQRLRFLKLRNKHRLRWSDDGTYATIPPARGLVPWLTSQGVAVADRYLLSHLFDNSRPELSADLLAALRKYYRDDVERTEAMLGVDLSAWK